MYMNRNRRMHGCRHRFKRLIMSILVLSMLLTVTGCGGASQTAGSRLNTQNAVDKVLNQKTGDGDVEVSRQWEPQQRRRSQQRCKPRQRQNPHL